MKIISTTVLLAISAIVASAQSSNPQAPSLGSSSGASVYSVSDPGASFAGASLHPIVTGGYLNNSGGGVNVQHQVGNTTIGVGVGGAFNGSYNHGSVGVSQPVGSVVVQGTAHTDTAGNHGGAASVTFPLRSSNK